MLVAGWLQRQQAATIDYLMAEIRMHRARLGGRRIIFTDAERRQLAEKARALGRKALRALGTIVTPETLLRWRREVVRANGPSLSDEGLVRHAPGKDWLG